MTLPIYVSKRKQGYVTDEAPTNNKETMLQAVLVALLACLVWGGPFGSTPSTQRGGGGGGDTLHPARNDVTQHLEGTMDARAMANFTEEELRYHYFQSHDFDGNEALDGMEMLKAVLHATPEKVSSWEPTEGHSDDSTEQNSTDTGGSDTAQFYVDVIDRVLSEGDLDKDGLLSYPEYVLANERAIQRQKEQDVPEQL